MNRQSDSPMSAPSLLIWSSPSTKSAGAYQLWENYKTSISHYIPQLTVLRGHASEDSYQNPQLKLNLRSAIWSLSSFRRILKSTETSNVVTSISQSDIIFGLIVRPFTKINWTIYVLGQPYPVLGQTGNIKRFVWKKLWLLAARRADKVIAVSDYMASIISADLKNAPISTVYPSLNDHRALIESLTPSSSSRLRVGFVGRLSPEKDPLLFCSIMAGFAGFEAKVFGDGPMRPQVQQRLENIAFLGFRSQSEIYSGIDVLMMTSKSEGLPMVLVEASHTGIIPLVCDIGGCKEAIHPKNRDFLVVPKADRENTAAWRARLERLKDHNLRHEIIDRQREWAKLKFDVRDNSKALANLVVPGAGL